MTASHANSTHGGVERILAARLSDQCERSGAAIVAGSNSARTTGAVRRVGIGTKRRLRGSWPPLHDNRGDDQRREEACDGYLPDAELRDGGRRAEGAEQVRQKVGSRTRTPNKAAPTRP